MAFLLTDSLHCAVYETVKKKEAERRRDAVVSESAEPRFADILKKEWEARKAEMAAAENAR